jgi:hypothetical protein
MVSDDEYFIFTLVKINDDFKSGQFLNEETDEIVTITSIELLEEYTMLTDYKFMLFAKIDNIVTTSIYYNEFLRQYLAAGIQSNIKDNIIWTIQMCFYKFMKRAVFNKIANYILNLNYPSQSLSESDKDYLWDVYFSYICGNASLPLFTTSELKVTTSPDEKVIDYDNNKISDSAIMEIESKLDTYILSYDIYEYDDSVNIDNVTMRHIMLYDQNTDAYYLVRYIIDTAKVAEKTISDMNDCIDVIEFMSQ